MDGGGHWWTVVDLGGLEVVDFFMGLTLFFAALGYTGLHWVTLGIFGVSKLESFFIGLTFFATNDAECLN